MSDLSRATGPPVRAGNLDFLRKQANALLKELKKGDPAALNRLECAPELKSCKAFTLSHAQLLIAREAGFDSWPKLQDELKFRQQARAMHRLGSASSLSPGDNMDTQQTLKLGAIDQIGLSCTDLELAEKFYCGTLGLNLVGATPDMKFFDCDGVNIIVFKSEKPAPASVIYFKVPGEKGLIEEKVKLLKAKGVKMESDAHVIARNWKGCDVSLAFFRDPFGNLLGLKSDVPVKR